MRGRFLIGFGSACQVGGFRFFGGKRNMGRCFAGQVETQVGGFGGVRFVGVRQLDLHDQQETEYHAQAYSLPAFWGGAYNSCHGSFGYEVTQKL